MANVLVAGGAGYIASFTRRALVAAGHKAIAYDNLSQGHREFVKDDNSLIIGDIREGQKLRCILEERKIDAVIHFAASTLARESVVEPSKFYDNNVVGHLSLLESCRAAGVGVFVLSSSCAIYGLPQYLPLDEKHPQNPINPYGRTKLACEWTLRDFSRAYNIRFAALRYFNAAGGDSIGQIGEWHDPESHLIPLAMTAAAKGTTLSIFGDTYHTPDGTCIRDYIHVADLARAHVLALDSLLDGGPSLELNLGTGIGHSIREVLDTVGRVVGRPVPAVVTDAQPGDPPKLVANPEHAREVLGFSCEWLDLEKTIASAWPFHQRLL